MSALPTGNSPRPTVELVNHRIGSDFGNIARGHEMYGRDAARDVAVSVCASVYFLPASQMQEGGKLFSPLLKSATDRPKKKGWPPSKLRRACLSHAPLQGHEMLFKFTMSKFVCGNVRNAACVSTIYNNIARGFPPLTLYPAQPATSTKSDLKNQRLLFRSWPCCRD